MWIHSLTFEYICIHMRAASTIETMGGRKDITNFQIICLYTYIHEYIHMHTHNIHI
jgi:hypothetical protein